MNLTKVYILQKYIFVPYVFDLILYLNLKYVIIHLN